MRHRVELARLVRYPVKGMAGQDLSGARVRAGSGLPYDRAVALAGGRGQDSAPLCGRWAPTSTFLNLRSTPELLRCRVEVVEDAGVLRLVHPERGTMSVALAEPGPLAPIDWFSARATLSGAAGGYWDDPDGAVSLINLASVEALGHVLATPVDPLRFRGNLYLSGLPAWAEFSLVGERIAVGDAELEVLHPINRCRATSVNPADAERDLPVPAELSAHVGHLFCGLRARVVTGGTLAVGDRISRTGRSITPALAIGGPPPARWPRPARTAARAERCPDGFCLWLVDPLAALRPAPLPGQYVRMHAYDDAGPLWRAYAVEDHSGALLRICHARDGTDDRIGALLHDPAVPDGALLMSGPYDRP